MNSSIDGQFVVARRTAEEGSILRVNLLEALGAAASERWLFIGPHDDDIVIAGGLLLQAALAAGVDVHCAVVTDGRQGYTRVEDAESIAAIRRSEAEESFALVGTVNPVVWMGYPDGDLARHGGRRRAVGEDEPDVRRGRTGLQNSLVAELRRIDPSRVFALSGVDHHPDHQVVYRELVISLIHAQGLIWPELGEPIGAIPSLYELAAYRSFVEPPDFQVTAQAQAFDRKLSAIGAYRSQRQIENIVAPMRRAGPVEYFRSVPFSFYDPRAYNTLFADEGADE